MIGPRNGVSGYLPVQASGMRVASPRDLAFVIDSNGYRWARLMHNLLREICHAVNQSETGVLSEAEDYATSCLDFFNHEIVIAATDLRCGTRCPLDDGDPLTNEVRSLGVGWLGCTVRVGYPDADRSASGTV